MNTGLLLLVAAGAGIALVLSKKGDSSAPSTGQCTVEGAPGTCVDQMACPNDSGHVSGAGTCGAPSNIRCCAPWTELTDNPPVGSGWGPMKQSDVTPEMTQWAVSILYDPANFPMHTSSMRSFGSITLLAVVQWHPPDFQASAPHRGVTLYEATS